MRSWPTCERTFRFASAGCSSVPTRETRSGLRDSVFGGVAIGSWIRRSSVLDGEVGGGVSRGKNGKVRRSLGFAQAFARGVIPLNEAV
jgi:hypothetical protein